MFNLPNTILSSTTLSIIAVLSFTIAFATTDVEAGEIIFHDAANAKIARLKSKARVLKNTREQDIVPSALGADAEDQTDAIGQTNCGSIDIANQAKPNIGRPQRASEVFILGDVINTGNNCG